MTPGATYRIQLSPGFEISHRSMRTLVNLGAEASELPAGTTPVIHLSSDPEAHMTESGTILAGNSVAIVGDSRNG